MISIAKTASTALRKSLSGYGMIGGQGVSPVISPVLPEDIAMSGPAPHAIIALNPSWRCLNVSCASNPARKPYFAAPRSCWPPLDSATNRGPPLGLFAHHRALVAHPLGGGI